MSQPILNLDELKTLEERMTHALGEGELMRRAGSVLAEEIASVTPPSGHVVFICGPGNNGGDGFTAARVLLARGFRVTCALIGCDKPKTQDARNAYEAWEKAGGPTIADPYNAAKADTVVDALFGTGVRSALKGDFLDAALWFNERRATRISVDIPSGLNPMTGFWLGGIKGCRDAPAHCGRCGKELREGNGGGTKNDRSGL